VARLAVLRRSVLYAVSVAALVYGVWALAQPAQVRGVFWFVLGALGLKSVHDSQRASAY